METMAICWLKDFMLLRESLNVGGLTLEQFHFLLVSFEE